MKNRRSLSALVVAAFAFGTVAMAAGTAGASTGGGCGALEGNVTACISASGRNVEPDLYINSVPGNCVDVVFQLIDDSTGSVSTSKVLPCTAGHFGPWPFAGVNGHYYKTFAQMSTTSGALSPSTSPVLHLAY
jgi:hypothetical protein